MTDPIPLDDWRAARRSDLLARRLAVTAEQREQWSARIRALLQAALPAPAGLRVASYTPFRGEPEIRPLIEQWRAAGATIALPVVIARGAAMEFRAWWPGAPLRHGAFKLPEPDGTPLVQPQLVLMPPVGFDARGYRLGYGGGYFDRTLAALMPAPVKLGVAYEMARLDDIRPQPYDIAMDFVVTEQALYRVTAAGLIDEGACTAFRACIAARIALEHTAEQDEPRPWASSPCYGHEDFNP